MSHNENTNVRNRDYGYCATGIIATHGTPLHGEPMRFVVRAPLADIDDTKPAVNGKGTLLKTVVIL